jgi:hypothetical protein
MKALCEGEMSLSMILPNYRIQFFCRVSGALGKTPITLGKAFAESNTRQRPLSKKVIGKAIFTECFLSDTRCRVLN